MPTPDAILWNTLMRRMQAIAQDAARADVCVMTVRVVLRHGELMQWREPEVAHFEPHNSDRLLEVLTHEPTT